MGPQESNCKCFAKPAEELNERCLCRFSATQACLATPPPSPKEPTPKAINNQSRPITMRAKRRNTLSLRRWRPQMACKLARKELQKNARIRCRLGFAGHEVRSRAYLDASEVPFGLQELLPSWCWTFGSQNEHKAGQLDPQLVLDVWRPTWARDWPTRGSESDHFGPEKCQK